MRNANNNVSSDPEKEKLNPLENGWSPEPRTSTQFNVIRRVYQQETLNRDADYHKPRRPWSHQWRSVVKKCGVGLCPLSSLLPIARWLPRYQFKQYAMGDCIAGATTAVMHIPQGMAYALLAEVAPVIGLYMAFFPVLIYIIFGTSPHISMGTFSVICLMAGKVVNQHTHYQLVNSTNVTDGVVGTHDSSYVLTSEFDPYQVLSAVCLVVGLFQLAMWALRLGAVSTLLSEPLVSGFTTAASFHVLASQLKDLLGIKIRLNKASTYYKVVQTLIATGESLPNVNYASVIISCITCFIISINNEFLKPWVSKRSRIPVPIELFAIVVGTLVSRFGDLNGMYGITLVGDIPTGLPKPELPPVKLLPQIAIDGFIITMVSYTISMSMALIFASKDKYEVDANQELLALGSSNVFASFFACAPFCASLSRSYIQYQAGAKTPITSLVSALLILLVVLYIGPFFEDLPRCVLASIIIVSLKGLFVQVGDLCKFWNLSKLDACVWLVSFWVTVLIGIDIGLGAGLLASVATLFCRSQQPYCCLLGRVDHTDLYLDVKRYRAASEIPGLKIFHYCGGLNFATKNLFKSTLFRKIGYMRPSTDSNSLPHTPTPDEDNNTHAYEWDPTITSRVQCVIIDATALSYVDAPGIKTLVAVEADLRNSNIVVFLTGANGPVLEMIERYNNYSLEGDKLRIETFPTVHDAVVYYKLLSSKKVEQTVSIT